MRTWTFAFSRSPLQERTAPLSQWAWVSGGPDDDRVTTKSVRKAARSRKRIADTTKFSVSGLS
jgi:hypothetical protein